MEEDAMTKQKTNIYCVNEINKRNIPTDLLGSEV